MLKIKFLPGIALLMFLSSCGGGPSPGGSGTLLPNITGTAGEVLIVMDNNIWREKPGLILKEMLEQEFPALPQPEPLFDVIQISPGAFDELFKRHRSIIIVDIGSENINPEIRFLENIWARPQLVIRINAGNGDALAKLLTESTAPPIFSLSKTGYFSAPVYFDSSMMKGPIRTAQKKQERYSNLISLTNEPSGRSISSEDG